MGFERWMQKCIVICERVAGTDPISAPDVDWHGFYEDELTPAEAVYEAACEWGVDVPESTLDKLERLSNHG